MLGPWSGAGIAFKGLTNQRVDVADAASALTSMVPMPDSFLGQLSIGVLVDALNRLVGAGLGGTSQK